jgi:hypothetical protein
MYEDDETYEDFEGPWKLVEVTGYESLGKTCLYFWGLDGTGQFDFAEMTVNMKCEYGETADGLPSVSFKLKGVRQGKAIRGSGIGAIDLDGKTLHGSVRIGRQTSGFVAHREGGQVRSASR